MKVLCALLSCLGLAALQAAPTQQYDHGDPTDSEQLMLEFINRARANPAAEGQIMITTSDPTVTNAISHFHVNTSLVASDFNAMPAVPPLAFHPLLMIAAQKHSQLLADNDSQSHQEPGELKLSDRILGEGYTFSGGISFGENVYSYMNTIFDGHAAFEIDWGNTPTGVQTPPGHRNNIHDTGIATATEIGIGIVSDTVSSANPPTGPLIVTQDFTRPDFPTDYVLGIVYEDKDRDGFYSVGEGLAGVTITPDQGDWFAVTSASGGYAIPLKLVSGTINVTASGGGLPADITKSFTYSSENVKVDFEKSEANGGGPTVPIQVPLVDFGSDSIAFSMTNFVQTAWFGGFFDLTAIGAANGWLYHLEHGSIYYIGDENGLWFYSSSLDWSYTSRALYPNIYSTRIGWIFYYTAPINQETTARFFFDYAQGKQFFNDPTQNDFLFY